jgi:hypothetical protein
MEAIALIHVTREDLDPGFWAEWAQRAEARVRTIVDEHNAGTRDDESSSAAIAEAKTQMRAEYDELLHQHALSQGYRCGVRPCEGETAYSWRTVNASIDYAYFVAPQGASSMAHMRAGDWNWYEFCKRRNKPNLVEPQFEAMTLDEEGRYQFPFLGPCTIRMQIVRADGSNVIVARLYVPKADVYRLVN